MATTTRILPVCISFLVATGDLKAAVEDYLGGVDLDRISSAGVLTLSIAEAG
jgi:hypothetical protein